MTKQIVLRQCDHCRKTAKRVETIDRHEKICVSNPNGMNCFVCVHQEYGPWYYDRWDGGHTVKDAHFCKIHEELCDKNKALNCADFERAGVAEFIPVLPQGFESDESAQAEREV